MKDRSALRINLIGLSALRRCLSRRTAGAAIAANKCARASTHGDLRLGYDQAEKYTAKADQRRLAESAMHLLEIMDAAAVPPLPLGRRP
jgi:hypothetical protein